MTSRQKLLWPITDEERKYADEQLDEQQRRVKFDVKEFTVELLVNKFVAEEIYVPRYQRQLVWNEQRKSKFIESVLIGLPIPFLFSSENPETANLEIVDGVQRIGTLTEFLREGLVLTDLERLTSVNQFRFEDLSLLQQRRFKNRTLRMITLEPSTDLNTRFDIFERINTGSEIVNPSELRKGAFPGPFYEFINKCAQHTKFMQICRVPAKRRRRAEHEELVLRYFAYADHYNDFKHDVWSFLNDYLKEKNKGFDHATKSREFEDMLRFVGANFPYGFAKSSGAKSTPRVRFEAISVGVHLALKKRPDLAQPDMSWLDSEAFQKHTTSHASNSAPRLRGRIEFVRDSLLGTL